MVSFCLTIALLPCHGASVDDVIAAEIKDHGIPGVSVAIIEKGERQAMTEVTGKPFTETMKETVLVPLKMTASTYEQPLPKDRVSFAASGYYSDGKAVKGKWHIYPEMAAAGLWSTPSDLARCAISIQQAAVGKANPIISQSMTREMLTVQKGSLGLGLFLEGSGESRRFSHRGRDEGFDAYMAASIESGQGLVVMINKNDDTGALMRILRAVSKEYKWPQD